MGDQSAETDLRKDVNPPKTDLRKEDITEKSLEDIKAVEVENRENRKQYDKKKFLIDYFDPVANLKLDNIIEKIMLSTNILDIASKQGEFVYAVYKKFGKNIANN